MNTSGTPTVAASYPADLMLSSAVSLRRFSTARSLSQLRAVSRTLVSSVLAGCLVSVFYPLFLTDGIHFI